MGGCAAPSLLGAGLGQELFSFDVLGRALVQQLAEPHTSVPMAQIVAVGVQGGRCQVVGDNKAAERA